MAEPTSKTRALFPMIKYRTTATYDPANLLTLTQDTIQSITVPSTVGVAVGDFVIVSHTTDLAGLLMHGYVSAANTIKVVCTNLTSGTVNLATGTLTVLVLDKNSGASAPF